MRTARGEVLTASRRQPRLAPRFLALALCLAPTLAACASQETLAEDTKSTRSVELVGFDAGDVLSGAVTVQATMTGIEELRGVEFYVGETRVDTVLMPPFETVIDTSQFADGEATLSAVVAIDNTTNVRDDVDVAFDNTGPVVSLTAPTETSLFFDGGELELFFDVSDASGVSALEVTASGIPLTVSGPPYVAKLDLATLSATEDNLPMTVPINVVATDAVAVPSATTFELELRSRLAWRFSTLGDIWAPPAFGLDGSVYFGSADGTLYAVDTNGSLRWSYDTGNEIRLSPAVDYATGTARIWVAAGGFVHVIDATGAPVGTPYDAGSTVATRPIIAGDRVLVGTFSGDLVALDATTLSPAWTFSTGFPVQGAPVVVNDNLIVFGSDDRRVYGIDANGAEVWRFSTGGEVWSDATLSANGDVLVGSNDGYLYSLSRFGTKNWEFEARGQIWGSATEGPDGKIFVSSTFRRLYGLDTQGGELWQTEASGFAYATPAVSSDGIVYTGATDGTLIVTRSDGTPLWQYTASGEITGSPRLSPDEAFIFFGSNDRQMYALHTGNVKAGTETCPPPEMVVIGGKQVMKYEASRPDATSSSEGSQVDRACSRPGVKPWTNVTWQQAREACAAIGMDLCGGALWEQACQGAAASAFPYGATYSPGVCNDAANPTGGCSGGACAPMTTGENPGCASASGAVDMSGNVREWTLDGANLSYTVRGGGFRDQHDDLSCSNVQPATHSLPTNSALDDVGFRCCVEPSS